MMDPKRGKTEEMVGAVGLVVENVVRQQAFFVTMLCVPRLRETGSISNGTFAVPQAGLARLDVLRRSSMMKSMRPLIGELMHFAEELPGGMPVCGRLPRNDALLLATYAIQKKVLDSQWDWAVHAAADYSRAIAAALPIVQSCSHDLEPLTPDFGSVGPSSLERFSELACFQSRRLSQVKVAEPDEARPNRSRSNRF